VLTALPASLPEPSILGVLPSGWAAAAAIFALHWECRSATMFSDRMGLYEGMAMRKNNPRVDVAVVATSDGRFTFQIFAISSEPKTLKISGQCYLTATDAAQAGYKVIASERL
jgi:hypothetical protein